MTPASRAVLAAHLGQAGTFSHRITTLHLSASDVLSITAVPTYRGGAGHAHIHCPHLLRLYENRSSFRPVTHGPAGRPPSPCASARDSDDLALLRVPSTTPDFVGAAEDDS